MQNWYQIKIYELGETYILKTIFFCSTKPLELQHFFYKNKKDRSAIEKAGMHKYTHFCVTP